MASEIACLCCPILAVCPLHRLHLFYISILVSIDVLISTAQKIASDLLRNMLHAGNGIDQKWEIEGANAPHDLAILAAPVRLAGSDRPLAVVVGETRQSDSHLQKYILLPYGEFFGDHHDGEGNAAPFTFLQDWSAWMCRLCCRNMIIILYIVCSIITSESI